MLSKIMQRDQWLYYCFYFWGWECNFPKDCHQKDFKDVQHSTKTALLLFLLLSMKWKINGLSSEAYFETFQTSEMKCFTKIVNDFDIWDNIFYQAKSIIKFS